jgi:hypothetical protein
MPSDITDVLDETVNYLQKPFTPDGLAERVGAVLDSKPD